MESTKNNVIKLDKIEDAIDDVRKGKLIIVVDDKDRENEGDFIGAAELVTADMINFLCNSEADPC